ncbi:ABC-2 type transporter-domain-containing protein [Radiomyces spectabilis]|uniref:ABC-2 type transporter-domain-containing protein n=1 Tax=Radiomyces spectabilis TaxID=64574 RepID=UPI0022211CF3|nr:ABC-2 type transporter-domain-containing protein [Radiomyces spectabilis]KAI8381275.1 ABC-2 type transporter-domain-containing protein [Radiomyces spectabilis]
MEKEENTTYINKRRSSDSASTIAPVQSGVFTGHESSFGEPNANAVNIEAAFHEFEDLKRELTHISRKTTNPSRLENGDTDEFNLKEFLHDLSKSRDAAGHTPKHLGVIWKNLTVEGLGADAYTIPTVLSDTLKVLQFWRYLGLGGKSRSKKTILRDLSGFVKEGEMLLVLGRPGAGCTSLLKVISNLRGSFTNVAGTVSYGGIDHATFAKRYQGQVCYNGEEDQHYPTLTTKQTLQFALRTKTPGARLPNESKKEFVNRVLFTLGNMLGLTKQMNTLVGNAFVRGLSGGERKRLSIAEQMTTESTINCWDCSTRGLDAASALDYVRSLRIMTDIFQKTTIATLYQASNSIFDLFDKVLLLDDGYCMYFGPVDAAKEYFESMGFYSPPRKSVPDFLTGLSNPLEREAKPGFEHRVPQTAAEFQERYLASAIHTQMMEQLDAYERELEREQHANIFRKAMDEEHQKRASNKSPYTASFYQQVKALTIRQYHLLIKDKEALVSRYGTIIVQSLIMASCFYKMPHDGTGAMARGGAIFFVILFNTLVSQTELISFMMGRPILDKHKQYALYRPSAFYLAQVIMDIPYAVVQVIIFELLAYFMMGFNLDAGRFFTFFIVIVFANLAFNGFFRVFGAMTNSFFIASQVSGVCSIAVYTYCGYFITEPFMHPWLSWIYYLSPAAYGVKAVISNEMKGQIYTCEGPGNSVPYGPGYDDWQYKVCTMKGGRAGENFVLGDNYLREALNFEPSDIWAPDFLAIVAFFLGFTIIIALAMEFFGGATGGGSLTKLYKPGKAPKLATTPEEEAERRRQQAEATQEMDAIATGTTFSWHHIDYTVPIKGGQIQLLNDISGIVKPGHLTALMGSSGAGKTTLLDVLARRKTLGKVEGNVYLNSEALMNDFERITGYCEQMDVHQSAVTVRESLRFSAYLRQPAEVSTEEKNAYVEKIIHLLEMEDIADAQIGDPDSGFGISVEERKRLTIGVELVGKPQLLFLDEPTSGLDAQSSYNIIRFIRKLADAGWPVLCTIHQPSAILFDYFDHLLLLVRGGRTAYYGEIGKDARTMINYFESHGGPLCSPEANPAEYILEVVGAGTAAKSTLNWADIWANSDEAKALEQELDQIHQNAVQQPTRKALTYATSLGTQLWLVHKRMALAYWRSPDYNIGRFITCMAISLLTGFTYWKMSMTSSDMMNRIFALYISFIMAYILIVVAQPKFMSERLYFRREYASRYYGWIPFSLSIILVETPYIIFLSAFYMFGFYWTAGLKTTSLAMGYFYLMQTLFVFWSVTLGFVIASISENPTVAAVLNPLIVCILVLFTGLMQTVTAMPHFWSSWMYWLDPFHYYVEGLVVNELSGLKVSCNDKDMVKFLPPPNMSCGDYLKPFFEHATGYLANPNATQPEYCNYCAFSTGDEYLKTFSWDVANQWRNIGIIIAFFIFNVFVFLAMVYWKRKPRR